ncbi:MAG TPA: polysaccharide deacetylase family protein [Solirubrobacteraceae bacterium]|jgi:peptidoglycan/xylan/chitin deacetylase (PgdA/CDA1 family)|nr:polysaccharide deacetylase family protein [Solirubrobacteraceae bacterium]
MSKRARAARFLDVTGVGALLRRAGTWHGALVLNYHRIGEPSRSLLDWDLWSATREDFDAQVGFLARNFELLGAEELGPDVLRARGRHAVVTFDDGYRDNHSVAYPVLREHGVRATFFLTTGFLDGDATAWWDEIAWLVRTSERDHVDPDGWLEQVVRFDEPGRQQAVALLRRRCASLPGARVDEFLDWLAGATGGQRRPADGHSDWMTWDMARELKRGGMTIGAHTVSHPVLASVPAEDQRREIERSLDRLEQELGERPRLFSYPVGWRSSFTPATKSLLRESGVRLAFSNYGGFPAPGNWDPYDVRRTNLSPDTSLSVFRATTTLPRLFARW